MACSNRQDLLDVTTKEFGKLSKLIDALDAEQGEWEADGPSIRQIIGHRAHWIDLFLGWYADGMAGKQVFFPAEGYKWNDLNRYNANLRAQQADLGWSAACALLQDRHDRLSGFIISKTDADLYAEPMRGANNKWTPGRWAEAAGPSHYRSAAKYIRSVLRSHA